MEYEGAYGIELAEDRAQCWAFSDAVINLPFPQSVEFIGYLTVTLSGEILQHSDLGYSVIFLQGSKDVTKTFGQNSLAQSCFEPGTPRILYTHRSVQSIPRNRFLSYWLQFPPNISTHLCYKVGLYYMETVSQSVSHLVTIIVEDEHAKEYRAQNFCFILYYIKIHSLLPTVSVRMATR